VFRRLDAPALKKVSRVQARRNTASTSMETPHPDERPPKKRRFFAEDSSPVHVSPIRPASPQSSVGSAAGAIQVDEIEGGAQNDDRFGGFDIGTLQAIVGELPSATLEKLKAVSGGDVQRGTRHSLQTGPPLT
jgi:DNA repair protein RAD5